MTNPSQDTHRITPVQNDPASGNGIWRDETTGELYETDEPLTEEELVEASNIGRVRRWSLNEIEEMLRRITPGEWKIRESPMGDGKYFVQAPRIDPKHPYDIEVLGEDEALYPTKRGDAEFIARAPQIVRQLIAALKPTNGEGMYGIALSDRIPGWYSIVDDTGSTVADCICSDKEATVIRDALNTAFWTKR